MSFILYCDIETLPHEDPTVTPPPKAPANYKDPAKIAEYIAQNAETAHRETSLDPLWGRICTISLAIENEDPIVFHTSDHGEAGERAALEWLDEQVAKARELEAGALPTWIGHYFATFDLRFLYFRAAKYGLKRLQAALPWERWQAAYLQDTTALAVGPAYRDRAPGLAKLCAYFGIEGKTPGVSGANVWDLFQAGEHQAIADYCAQDVRAVRALHQKLASPTVKEKR